jgi:hypothetical protein
LFQGERKSLTSSDIIARSPKLVEALKVSIAELDMLQLDCQILDMVGYMGRQWLWIRSVNNLSRHAEQMFLLILLRCTATPSRKMLHTEENEEYGQQRR